MRQAEAGTAVGDVCRQLGISETTFYAWKKKYAHLASMKQPLAIPGWKSFHRYRLQRRGNRKVPGGAVLLRSQHRSRLEAYFGQLILRADRSFRTAEVTGTAVLARRRATRQAGESHVFHRDAVTVRAWRTAWPRGVPTGRRAGAVAA